MNKETYMAQLKSLLSNISEAERDEALQYYNDYFEDAGAENEEEVISQLGSPEKLADNIIRDLSGNSYDGLYDESVRRKPVNSVVKYGETFAEEENKNEQNLKTNNDQEAYIRVLGATSPNAAKNPGGMDVQTMANAAIASAGGILPNGVRASYTGDSGTSNNTMGGMNNMSGMATATEAGMYNNGMQNGAGYNAGGNYGNNGAPNGNTAEKKSNGFATAMLILTSPIWGTLLLVGCIILCALMIAWFAVLIAIAAVTFALFFAAISLVVSGVMAMAVSWPIGLAVAGCGCIIIGFAFLFLMLMVALAGIVTPAMFRGIGSLFHGNKK